MGGCKKDNVYGKKEDLFEKHEACYSVKALLKACAKSFVLSTFVTEAQQHTFSKQTK